MTLNLNMASPLRFQFLLLCLFLMSSGVICAAQPKAPPNTPTELQNLKADDLKKMLSAPAEGTRASVVNLWATWCAPCVKEMPELVAFAKKNAARGLRLILLSADDPEDQKRALAVLEKSGVDFPAYILTQAPDEFMKPFIKNWSSVVPTTILFDQKGGRVATWAGELRFAELQKRVDQLLRTPSQGKKPNPERSK